LVVLVRSESHSGDHNERSIREGGKAMAKRRSGLWIAWSVLRRPYAAQAVGVGAQPRVQ
jgi:hypothetical protein